MYSLFSLVVDLAFDIFKDAGVSFLSEMGVNLIRQVLDIQGTQTALLRAIDAKGQRLLDGPWERAHMYRRDAAIPGRTPAEVQASLQAARAAMFEAIPLQPPTSGKGDGAR